MTRVIPMICLWCFALAVIPLLTGCDEVDLSSQWSSKPMILTDSNAGWPENGQYYAEKSRMTISVLNDADHLYVRLSTRSKTSKMMLLRGGLTTWLDENGGAEKTMGVIFPIAQSEQWMGQKTDHRMRYAMAEILEDSQHNLALVHGQGGDRRTMTVIKAAEMGIIVKLGLQQDYLTYELKIPYVAEEGKRVIRLGFETGELEKPKGGGKGGRGNGSGGRKGGGKSKSAKAERPEPLEIWFNVQLAGHSEV